MSTIFGQDEPHRWPKKAYFSCAIGVYFMSFFYEHSVEVHCTSALKQNPGTPIMVNEFMFDKISNPQLNWKSILEINLGYLFMNW